MSGIHIPSEKARCSKVLGSVQGAAQSPKHRDSQQHSAKVDRLRRYWQARV